MVAVPKPNVEPRRSGVGHEQCPSAVGESEIRLGESEIRLGPQEGCSANRPESPASK